MDERLKEVRTPFGGPRFFPAGTHPAAYRLRQHLRRLYEFHGTGQVGEAIDYCERQIDAVEKGELAAKFRYLLAAPPAEGDQKR